MLKKDFTIHPTLRPTAELFVVESKKEMGHIQTLLALPALDCQRQLEVIFHRIKGGAGFLGLTEIRDRAKEAEDICQHSSLKHSQTLVQLKALQQNIEELLNKLQDFLNS